MLVDNVLIGNDFAINYFYVSAVFEVLTEEHIPDLHNRLKKMGVLSMVSLSWFLTIFIR